MIAANHDSEAVRERFIKTFDAKNDDGLAHLGKANIVALVPSSTTEIYDMEFAEMDTVIEGFEKSTHGSILCADALHGGEVVGVYNREFIADICDVLGVSLAELATYCVVRTQDERSETPLVVETDEWYICLAGRIVDA